MIMIVLIMVLLLGYSITSTVQEEDDPRMQQLNENVHPRWQDIEYLHYKRNSFITQ